MVVALVVARQQEVSSRTHGHGRGHGRSHGHGRGHSYGHGHSQGYPGQMYCNMSVLLIKLFFW